MPFASTWRSRIPEARTAVLENAFEELGRDNQPPSITFESPVVGMNYCPGSTLNAHFTVSEEAPGYLTTVSWLLSQPRLGDVLGSCPCRPGRNDLSTAPSTCPSTRNFPWTTLSTFP